MKISVLNFDNFLISYLSEKTQGLKTVQAVDIALDFST